MRKLFQTIYYTTMNKLRFKATVEQKIFNLYIGYHYQVHYMDNDEDTWTVPVCLTKERAEDIISDGSIDCIKILSILNTTSSEYQVEDVLFII